MKTFQFKIQLKDIQNPPVWRRVLVPEEIVFDEFHLVIQAVFGWEGYHLYQFSPKGWGSQPLIKLPDPEDAGYETEDSSIIKLSAIFTAAGQTYTYIYDFGDGWKHQILLEKILDEKIIAPICTAGKGACPPEDCGGIPGYYNLLEILGDPKHREHKEMKKWLGLGKNDIWDVNAFDIDEVNERFRED